MNHVIVVPHNLQWSEAFAAAAKPLAAALGNNLLAIHHIGSTAIPGIYAKPVIDLLPVVSDIAAVDLDNAAMQLLGYEAKGEFGIPGRRFFRKDDAAGIRTHNVHVFQTGSPDIDRHLFFRDFMRAHPGWAIQYSDLKRKLAAEYPNDIEAYMDGKDSFIKDIEAKALVWQRQVVLSVKS